MWEHFDALSQDIAAAYVDAPEVERRLAAATVRNGAQTAGSALVQEKSR